MTLILKGALITPSCQINGGAVAIDAGKITTVGPAKDMPIPENAEVKDFGERSICPGFIDVHAQGAGGYDILDAAYEALNTISKTLAKSGTTGFLATTVTTGGNKHLAAAADAIKKGTEGAAILGIHLEGPFINAEKRGMIQPENVLRPDKKLLDKILDVCGGALKMMTIAPEVKGNLELIKGLAKNRIVASLGHTLSSYEEAKAGIDAGITHTTHIFNAMTEFHHRRPGAAGAVLDDDRVSVQMISDGAHLDPAVVRLLTKIKGPDRIALITDSMSASGLPDGKYVYNNLEYESRDGLARYKDGTFIGTALTLNKIIKRLMKFTGVSLYEAVRMASLTPANILGIEDKKGSLEAGKDADIVVMDKNFNVEFVVVEGEKI